MDLNEQAKAAVAAVLTETGSALDSYELRLARLVWLAGFKAGSDATLSAAREVIARELAS